MTQSILLCKRLVHLHSSFEIYILLLLKEKIFGICVYMFWSLYSNIYSHRFNRVGLFEHFEFENHLCRTTTPENTEESKAVDTGGLPSFSKWHKKASIYRPPESGELPPWVAVKKKKKMPCDSTCHKGRVVNNDIQATSSYRIVHSFGFVLGHELSNTKCF